MRSQLRGRLAGGVEWTRSVRLTSSSMTVEKNRRLRAPVRASVKDASRSSRLAAASSALRAATASSRRRRSASRCRVRQRTKKARAAAAARSPEDPRPDGLPPRGLHAEREDGGLPRLLSERGHAQDLEAIVAARERREARLRQLGLRVLVDEADHAVPVADLARLDEGQAGPGDAEVALARAREWPPTEGSRRRSPALTDVMTTCGGGSGAGGTPARKRIEAPARAQPDRAVRRRRRTRSGRGRR